MIRNADRFHVKDLGPRQLIGVLDWALANLLVTDRVVDCIFDRLFPRVLAKVLIALVRVLVTLYEKTDTS